MPLADEGRPSAARWDVGSWFLLVAIIALLVARVPLIAVRVFDNDEFEHAHAAWSVFRGLVPYRDFFEHHTPWYYFALSPFFHWFPVAESFEAARHFLIFGRLLSLALTALSVVLIFLVGRVAAESPRRSLGRALPRRAAGADAEDPGDPSRRAGAPVLHRRALVSAAAGSAQTRSSPARRLRVVSGRRALPRGGHHVHAEDAVRSPGRARGPRALDLGGRAGGVARFPALRGAGPAPGRRRAGAAHLERIRARRRRRSIHLRQLSPQRARAAGARTGPCRSSSRPAGRSLLLCLLGGWDALSVAAGPSGAKPATSCSSPSWAGSSWGFPSSGWLTSSTTCRPDHRLPVCGTRPLPADRAEPASRSSAGVWLIIGATVPLLIWPVIELRRTLDVRNDVQMGRLRVVYARRAPTSGCWTDGWAPTFSARTRSTTSSCTASCRRCSPRARRTPTSDALTSDADRPALITLDDELRALGPRFLEFVRRHYVSLRRSVLPARRALRSIDGRGGPPAQIDAVRLRLGESEDDARALEARSVGGQLVVARSDGSRTARLTSSRCRDTQQPRRRRAIASATSCLIQSLVPPANAGA